MSTWEPDSWTFSGATFKKYDADSSSDGDTSDDEQQQLFSKSKSLRKTPYKKLTKEELLPE